jgi:hypothetical protein
MLVCPEIDTVQAARPVVQTDDERTGGAGGGVSAAAGCVDDNTTKGNTIIVTAAAAAVAVLVQLTDKAGDIAVRLWLIHVELDSSQRLISENFQRESLCNISFWWLLLEILGSGRAD